MAAKKGSDGQFRWVERENMTPAQKAEFQRRFRAGVAILKEREAKVAAAKVAAPQVSEDTEVLVKHFESNMIDFQSLQDGIMSAFTRRCPKEVTDKIHSTKIRIKDPDSLRFKLNEKAKVPAESPRKKYYTKENFFEQIDDLVGFRIITLYRWDRKAVHDFIHACKGWSVVDEEMSGELNEDFRDQKELGIKKHVIRPYPGIHYAVVLNAGTKSPRCEIQLRGLHLEGWAEVDHKFKYKGNCSPVTKDILEALNRATLVADWLAHLAVKVEDQHVAFEKERTAHEADSQALSEKVIDLNAKLARGEETGDVARWALEEITKLQAEVAELRKIQAVAPLSATLTEELDAHADAPRCVNCNRPVRGRIEQALNDRCWSCNELFCLACTPPDGPAVPICNACLIQHGPDGGPEYDSSD